MGRSDPVIMPEYVSFIQRNLSGLSPDKVAYLGQPNHNAVSRSFPGLTSCDFFDRSLGNWDINDDKWPLAREAYDLIVCTRCAYFSSSPGRFVARVMKSLSPTGKAMIDWGLGDHWRFSPYKVGWIDPDSGAQEYAYTDDNFLWSCMWRDEWSEDPTVATFWRRAQSVRPSYRLEKHELVDVLAREVPCIVDYDTLDVKHVTLWEDSPQLYTLTMVGPRRTA